MNSHSETAQPHALADKDAEYIVAISFSMAEFDDLQDFFKALPANSKMAIVLVPQNAADFTSAERDKLETLAPARVLPIAPSLTPLAERIYLLGSRNLGLRNGKFCEQGKSGGSITPADNFLTSLGRDQKDKAAVIVMGASGIVPVAGLTAIHASAGVVLSHARLCEALPAAVDAVLHCSLSVAQMPAFLASLLQNPYLLLQQASGRDAHLIDTAISSILGLLKSVYDTDFQVYKRNIFLRRLERQLRICKLTSAEDYFTHISANRTDLHRLYLDLQFGTPTFFRNADLLNFLQHMVFTQVLQQTEHEHEIRIWVPCCATGEETYSLGMLLLDLMDSLSSRKLLRIFATDINETRLKIASDGVYSASQLLHMPESLRARYFTALDDGRFKIVAALRNRIHFSRHNLLADVPFNGIDFIFSQNLLNLLNPEARIYGLSSIFFALKLHGILLLGTGETLSEFGKEFEKLELQWNLYRKIEAVSPRLKFDRDRFAKSRSEKNQSSESRMNRIYDILLNRHIPPGVLIDEKRQVLHIFGNINRYLHPAAGRSSNDLTAMLDGNIKAAVTSLIYNSFNRNASLSVRDLQSQKGDRQLVDINSSFIVDPVTKIKYLLISFNESAADVSSLDIKRQSGLPALPQTQEYVTNLEKELVDTRASLQAAVEQMESANNELQARYTELQDVNDVLAASNDQLLSTNEELRLFNAEQRNLSDELSLKVEELEAKTSGLEEAGNDLRNLIAAAEMAMVITDDQLDLRFYTPAAARLLQLTPDNIGKPVQKLLALNPAADLNDVIVAVQQGKLDDGREIVTAGGILHRKVIAYERNGAVGASVVIVFTDITGLSQAQASLSENEQQIKGVMNSLQHMIWTTDPQGDTTYVNTYLLNYTGVSATELQTGDNTSLVHAEDRPQLHEQWKRALATGIGFQHVCRFRRQDGVYRWFRLDAVPMRKEDGTIYQWLGSCVDTQEGKAADDQVMEVVQGAPLAIIMFDGDCIIRQVNRQTQLWFGYTEKELIGQEVEMLIAAEARAQHLEYLHKYMEQPQSRSLGFNRPLNGLRKSGETFGVEIGLNPVELGGQRFVMAFITDITLKIQAEKYLKDVNDSLEHVIEERSQALLESQRRLQLATQTAEIGVFDYDIASGRVTYDNKMFELFGIPRTPDMVIDLEVWRSCLVEEDADAQLQLLRSSTDPKNVNLRSTYRIRRYDNNELRYIYSNRRSVTDAAGKVVRIIGVNRDITESKKVELELRELTFSLEEKVRMRTREVIESEHRLRQMTDTSSVLFWITDAAGKLTWVNKTWEDWTGRSMQAEIDGDWSSFIHPDDRRQTMTILQSHIEHGESFSMEYRLLNAQRNYGWIYHQGSPLYNNDGEMEGCIGTCTDITWQKERAEEQKRIEKKLEATAKLDSLGLMAGGVAHDFNNLLTGILGNIELAQWEVNSEQPMLKTVLSDARMATLRAADLCKQMLAYSGKGQFLTENCDVNEVVLETLRFISNSIKHEVKVLTHLDESIPSIIADKVQLQQIIMNLTINAGESIAEKGVVIIRTGITSMDKENEHALVSSDSDQREAAIFIEIRDNGIGMTPEELSHAFEPFYTTKFIGRGLGLAAVQGIVKGHGGTLVVETTKGKGTLMRVALPVFQVTKADSQGAANKKDLGWDSKILIVDDEEIVARTLHRYLEHMRIPSAYVLSGKECVSRFIEDPHAYDLVILDLTMAGMDGYETFTQIKKYNPDVKVVLISGFTEKEATRFFGSDDLAGFLPKPISEKALADVIKKLAK